MKKYFIITYDKYSNILEEKEYITDDYQTAVSEAAETFNSDKKIKMCLLTDENKNILLKYTEENTDIEQQEDWYDDEEEFDFYEDY